MATACSTKPTRYAATTSIVRPSRTERATKPQSPSGVVVEAADGVRLDDGGDAEDGGREQARRPGRGPATASAVVARAASWPIFTLALGSRMNFIWSARVMA